MIGPRLPDSDEITIVGIGIGLLASTWLGATIALLLAGEPALLSLDHLRHALPNLFWDPSQPAAAWPEPHNQHLPAPTLYWTITAISALAVTILVTLGLRRWAGTPAAGTTPRTPLGVDSNAHFATRRHLRPLLTRRPQPGRLIIARHGRHLLATEETPTTTTRRRTTGGQRGAVALIGPSQSGKTTTAIAGINHWHGPALLASVKNDLLAATRHHRQQLGTVQIFDPTGTTIPAAESARWSPLQHASTPEDAQRAARALCDAAPRSGTDATADFWHTQAEILLSGLAYLAHHEGRTMSDLCHWVLTQDHPTPDDPGQIQPIIERLCANPTTATAAAHAASWVQAIWGLEERTRSSVYATAQTIIWPWTTPTIATSANTTTHQPVTLNQLLESNNTLYLCAPLDDQHRLTPVFGGLLNDLLTATYHHVAHTGRPIDPPLLVVLDEAGNTPLRRLPEYASTLAGLGVTLVTIWQSLAQLHATYGPRADTILTNHLTKLFFPGISDPATLDYLAHITGDTQQITHTTTTDGTRLTHQHTPHRTPLLPPHAPRQAPTGHALLLHHTLPPAQVRTLKPAQAHPTPSGIPEQGPAGG